MYAIRSYYEKTIKNLPPELQTERADNRILAMALEIKNSCKCPLIFVTKDTNLRIKADAVGLDAADYESDKVSIDELYSGTSEVSVSKDEVDRFYVITSYSIHYTKLYEIEIIFPSFFRPRDNHSSINSRCRVFPASTSAMAWVRRSAFFA